MTTALSIRSYRLRDKECAPFTESLIDCYCRVFADPPWNERWEREAVEAMLERRSSPMDVIACEGDQVVGFAFARLERASDLERELGIGIADALQARRYALGPGSMAVWDPETVLYQADLGVLAERRKQGLGKRLFAARFRRNQQAYQLVRARVTPEPSVTYLWYTEKLGYEVIARYGEEDGRVILFQRGDVLAELTRSWEDY